MMDPSLRKRIKELEIHALGLMSNRFMGEWSSNVRGQGIEFLDLREYIPGDDVRRLDWKATARSGRPQLRRFTEERQQTIWLVLDMSASMAGAKEVMAQELLAVMGWAAVRQGDRFGILGFSDKLEFHREPARGEAQLWASLEDVMEHRAQSPRTSFAPIWNFFLTRPGHRATVIVISDFHGELAPQKLRAVALRHDVMMLSLDNPPKEMPFLGGLSPWLDSETGELHWIDGSSKDAAQILAQEYLEHAAFIAHSCKKSGVWHQHFETGRPWLKPLLGFFQRRREFIGVH